jgi:uncharacterized membrane protein
MSKRWIVILLCISLAFNIAVMGMFLFMTVYHRPPFCPPGMERGRDGDRERKPDAELNPAMRKLMDENKAEMRKFRDDFAQKRRDFMLILANDTLNVKAAEAAMEASLKAHEDLERKLGSSMINLRKNMKPADAKAFFTERMERMQHKTDKFRQEHKRFDQNNRQERR